MTTTISNGSLAKGVVDIPFNYIPLHVAEVRLSQIKGHNLNSTISFRETPRAEAPSLNGTNAAKLLASF